MMQCLFRLVFLFCHLCCSQYQVAKLPDFLPPPLLVTCSKPENRVYQRQDNNFRISCLWDGYIVMVYSRLDSDKEINSGKEESDFQSPPYCQWYRDAILVNTTNRWSGHLMMGPGLPGEGPHPPWAYSQITVQCASVLCAAPSCFYHNLSIQVSGQDVRLFLFRPRTVPVFEWEPVQLGWCARLKSPTWIYHFRSQEGNPEDILMHSNQYNDPPPFIAYPNTELHQVCRSYYSYHLTVRYPHRGFHTASVSIEHGPPISLSMDFFVEPALLHVFSAHPQLLSHPHGTLQLSWSFLPLGQGTVIYKLLDMQGRRGWSYSYNYNPLSLHSNFCAVHTPCNSKEKVVASIYFHTNKRLTKRFTGELDFSNETLIFRTSSATPIFLTLNPAKIKVGTYIVSHTLGLFYSIQESATGNNSSSHYIFYQQASFSYLIIVEFLQLQLFRFSMNIYLNRNGTLFRSLGEKEIEIHVFNSSSHEERLFYVVWFIPVQHPLLQCEWTFSLQLFDPGVRYPIQNNTFTYLDQVRNATHFIPDRDLPFNPALYTGFVAQVKCTGNYSMPIILKATFNTYASKVIEARIACQHQPCSIIDIRIQRSSTSRHIYYAQGTEFIVTADARINCPGRKQVHIIWNIYQVPYVAYTPNWSKPFNPPGIGKRNDATLKVPSSSLDNGLYLFNFTMKLTSLDTRDTKVASDSVFIEIGPDSLVAVIDGGSFRTVRFSDRWTLNGSLLSHGVAIQPSEELTFTWYCTKQKKDYASMTLSRNGKCHPDQAGLKWRSSLDPIQIVQPKTLLGNNTYYFLLVVQDGSRTAQAEQTVSVQVHSALILNVTCLENCGTSVIPTERFCLSGKCLNCRTIKPLYHWSLYSAKSSEIDFDWSSKTTTGRSSSYLRINAFAFVSMAEQSYILSLTIVTKEGESTTYEYFFHVNGPPQIGKCVLNPRTGTAVLTKFTIQCNGFDDKNGPLMYKVIAAASQKKTSTISSIENSTLGIIVYAGHEHKTPHFFLPIGIPSENSALIIYVQVYDSLGACSQVTLQATVRNQRQSKSVDDVHQKLHALLTREGAPMTTLPVSKSHLKIGYFVYTLASLLNTIKILSTIQGSKTDLRQTLLHMTADMPTMDVQEINQVILSICQVTHETNEINRESQLLAVRKLREVSEALKRHRAKDLGSKQTEILGSGIFTGLSNVLRASLLNGGDSSVDIVKETISVMEILADLILQGKVPGEYETNMETENWTIHLRKDEKWDVSGNFSNKKCCRNCFYPKLKESHHPELQLDAIVSTTFYEFEINPFPWLLFAKDIGTVVAGFKMTGTKSNGDTVTIMPDVAEVIMARKDGGLFDLTIGPDKKLSKTTGGFSFEIRRGSKDVFIQIVSQIKITFQVFIYLGHNISHPPVATYIVSNHSPPTSNKMQNNTTACAIKAPYIFCLPQSFFWPQVSNDRVDILNISVVLQSHPIVRDQTTKIVRVALFAAECLDLVGLQSQWKEGTCSLGPQTSWSKIHCICEGKKRSMRKAIPWSAETSEPAIRFLASKVVLFPNQVDRKRSLVSQTGHNPVTWWTVLAIFIAYIFLAIWVLTKDKMPRKDRVIDLPDNDPFHKMRYLVTIYTGSRLRSGTQATVFIQLIGQNGVSDVHQLKHPQFPRIFYRGSTDTFLLTAKMDLGDLSSLHVWHNNRYFGSNWYLSRVQVQNMDTKQSWLFMCRKWLALGKDDCQIERTLPVTNQNTPLSTMDSFLITVSNGFSDHLWLSVFARTIDDSFSRFQRLSCCLAILLSSLVFNIMFFSIEYDQRVHLVDLQPLRSIRIGIQSALMAIPVQVIVTTFFKHSVKKPCNTGPRVKERSSFPFESSSKEESLKDASLTNMMSKPFSPTDLNVNNNTAKKERFSEKIQKPPLLVCFLVTAWSFVFCTSGLSSFVIILHGLSYDEKTSFEWLIASLTSFGLNMFLFETLKMVAISAWNTGSARYCGDIPWSSYQDIQFHGRTMTAEEMAQSHRELIRLRASKQYQPIKGEELTVLRKIENIMNLGYIFVKNMIWHLIFLHLILTATHPAEITKSFYYNQVIYNTFSVGLYKIHTIGDIYNWVKDIFVPLIHNDYQPTYLLETWSKVLGLARMRQIRSTDAVKTCYFPQGLENTYILGSIHCQNKYGIDPEDQTDYLGSWKMPINRSVPNDTSGFLGFMFEHPTAQWEYNSYGRLNSYPSRGYTFYFFPGEPQANSTTRLKTLERSKWLDDKTWVLIVELTTFNPDADLFCSISIIFEFSNIGSVNSSVSVHSYKLPLLHDQSKTQILLLLGTLYMLIVYIADECRMLYQQRLRYINTAANLINFGIKTICSLFLVLFLFKFKLAFDLIQFYLLHQEQFIPFHAVSQFDQVINIIMGLLVFFLVLKMYRYFRFLYGVRLAQKSLFVALPTIMNLSIAGGIFFFAYMSLGYLGFGQHEWNFHTVIYSFATVLSYCALAFRNVEFLSDKLLGGIFLGSFMVVMICVFVNLSQVILIASHVDMKQPVYEHSSHEAEVIYYVIQKIYRAWVFVTTGTKTTTETHIFNHFLFGKPRRTLKLKV